MKKSVFGLLMTTVMLLSLAAPLIAIPSVAADDADWYMTVPGVLKSDYYSLYPYEKANLEVGFSKFGELINSVDNVGLEYNDAVDPYAYPAGSSISSTVPKRMWVQGWFINVTYMHRTLGERWVWAGAMHSDSVVYGNDWVRVDLANDKTVTYGLEDFRDPGYFIGASPYGTTLVQGGRKTNGTAVTEDIEVLYNGPREFIAVCRTTLWDHLVYGSDGRESDVALLQLAITIRFDKVKKCVVLYKDVKSLLVEKEGIKMKIQFSNRGEVDLGTASVGVSSYAHFWTEGDLGAESEDDYAEGLDTVYNSAYHAIKTEDPRDAEYQGFSAAGDYPQDYTATYDYAQAVNPSADYAWSAAFWPSLSDWSIDGWDQWWHSMTANDPHYIDYHTPADEPFIPFYIGEWDFVLYHTLDSNEPYPRTQFRGVTQYAVTALHDGDDANRDAPPPSANVIDEEMSYYLNETFNPWDLVDAVHKDTERHVAWSQGATSFTTKAPAVYVPDKEWNEYCVFSERILRGNTTLLQRGTGYTVTYNSATGTMTFSGLPSGVNSKILYSTRDYQSATDMFTPFTFSQVINTSTANPDSVTFSGIENEKTWTDWMGGVHTFSLYDYEFTVALVNGTDANFNDTLSILSNSDTYGWEEDFVVNKEDEYQGSWDFIANDRPLLTTNNGNASLTINELDVHWYINPPIAEALRVSYLLFDFDFTVRVTFNVSAPYLMNVSLTVDPYTTVTVSEMGRYEWAEVGRDAASVDSAGAALVAEALDSYKNIGIGLAGADMDNPVASNNMPSVMAAFGTGTSVADYKDAIFRAALKDDWCTTWPVASSNMLGVGGPLANLLSYYVNDFTDAMYGTPQFSGTAYSGKIAAVSCWDRNWLNETGYNTYTSYGMGPYYLGAAVISTYKDINGTVIFDVWGMEGRDTYYASLWLHGDEERGLTPGILEMQRFPKGVTSIVLYIWYGANWKHPLYSIPEMLGTISETRMSIIGETDGMSVYGGLYKGGIHDP